MEIATGYEAALRAQISSMEDQRSKLLSELARLDGHIEGLYQALALYLDESRLRCISAASDPREARTPDPESAWAHIMEMLENAAPSEVSVDAMDSFLARSGFGVARATLRTNLSKAVDAGSIERVRWGYYRKAQIQNGQAESYVHHLPGVEADNADGG